MSSFAEKQLKKYGWTEGEGLGKSNTGIAVPIKASFKFNNTGVGYDMAEEFTSNWWEHLFNHTAKKIETTQDNVLAETEPVKKDEAKPNDDQRKSYFYSRFQKGSQLVDGQNIEVPKSERKHAEKKADDYDKKGKKIVSDEDLFLLCEGRTAHKGARHGIKMNGKLARIEQMEKLEHDRLMAEKSKKTFDTVENSNGDSSIEKRKKKKKKKKSSEEDEETNEVVKKKKKN